LKIWKAHESVDFQVFFCLKKSEGVGLAAIGAFINARTCSLLRMLRQPVSNSEIELERAAQGRSRLSSSIKRFQGRRVSRAGFTG